MMQLLLAGTINNEQVSITNSADIINSENFIGDPI